MAWRRIWRHSHAAAAAIGCSRQPMPSVPPPFAPFQRRPTSLSPNLKEFFASCRRFSRRFSSDAWVDPPTEEVVEVPLAQTGEGIAECELLRWFVDEGAHVEEFQPLCEVQSDKATMEITSRYKGKVFQILFVPGDIVKVGESLLKMVIIDESRTSEGPGGSSGTHKPELHEPDCESLLNNDATIRGVLATPSVRQLAKQHGLDINAICGTGKEGRVTREDVLSYATDKGVGILSSSLQYNKPLLMEEVIVDNIDVQSYRDKRIPLRGFQRSMVKSMTMTAKVPHFHFLEEINCGALVELKASFQNENTDQEVKHTFLPFLIKSLSMALSKYPLLNSSFIEESNEVLLKGYHNIGVAMATSYGLVVPNIKKVQSLSILQITKELSRLHKLAANNKLSTEDITGGTITLSNIGAIGGMFGSPLLNLPEVAIIALGKIRSLPRFADDGTLYPASVTNVNIGADHRVVDGATVARFCNEWKLLIEKPELLLLYMH